MASTFYDWHFARSQNRMEQKPLFDNGVRVEKYHHKAGLVLTFLAVVSAKQISILLDHKDTLEVRNQINALYPTDEVVRLRIAMTSIRTMANNMANTAQTTHHAELIQAIIDATNIK